MIFISLIVNYVHLCTNTFVWGFVVRYVEKCRVFSGFHSHHMGIPVRGESFLVCVYVG